MARVIGSGWCPEKDYDPRESLVPKDGEIRHDFVIDGSKRPVGARFLEKRGEYGVSGKTADFFCTEYSDLSGRLNLWAVGP
jgi:hypothetical protein